MKQDTTNTLPPQTILPNKHCDKQQFCQSQTQTEKKDFTFTGNQIDGDKSNNRANFDVTATDAQDAQSQINQLKRNIRPLQAILIPDIT